MLLAVIRLGLRVARNLYNHFCFDRVDLEPAVGNFKRHLREVLALVIRELVSGQTHRVGTRVGALRFRGASKREVICRVQRVADAGNRIALDAVLLAVIRLGLRVALNLYNHFGFDRVDLEPAVSNVKPHVREVAVRVCELVSVQPHRVGAHIRSRRFRGAAEREVSRRVIYTLGGRDRHFIALNRLFASVIRYGVIMSRDRHNHFVRDRRDLKLAVDRLRNDILSCRVNRSNRTFRKRCRICSDIRSRRANGDRAEISAVRSSGKAGNAMHVSIISHRGAVRFQLDVLIIVEIDYVRSLGDRDRLGGIRYRRIAIDLNGGFRHGTAKICFFCLRLNRFILFSHPVVVHRVVSLHRPHVFIIELYIFYRFVKIYLGVKIRIAFPFCF